MAVEPVTEITSISPIGYREAMVLAATETKRLLSLVDEMDEDDWTRRTDCTEWDVKGLLSHVLGGMKADSATHEYLRQFWLATRASRHSGRPMVDEMNTRQVSEHASMSGSDMTTALHLWGPKALRGRRRTAPPVRAIKVRPGPPFQGKISLGYIIGVLRNRDLWLHRVDLARATGRHHLLTPQHDGRMIADMVAEWARDHNQPFTLQLTGPAGGTFTQGINGTTHTLDAVEFCRILSGRARGDGLLAQTSFNQTDA
jgi:uncharacterized protein (TIGR03083 family)